MQELGSKDSASRVSRVAPLQKILTTHANSFRFVPDDIQGNTCYTASH